MFALGIDTSNYATSLAIYDSAAGSICVMKKQFLPVKKGTLGLRQSDAVFHHTAALGQMLRELDGQFSLHRVDCIGASVAPRPQDGSYMPCFLVGQTAAQSFSLAKNIPFIQTTHQQGHIAAALFAAGRNDLFEGQALMFHVSGGTTELVLSDRLQVKQVIGQSLDLYAGQAIDRLGVRLGFDFPAGAEVSRLAENCIDPINPKVSLSQADCHFSGLENQYIKLLADGAAPAYAAKYCLTAIAKTLAAMLNNARKSYPGVPCICAGGVMSSSVIRSYMEKQFADIAFVPGEYSADNAAGVAIIAAKEAQNG